MGSQRALGCALFVMLIFLTFLAVTGMGRLSPSEFFGRIGRFFDDDPDELFEQGKQAYDDQNYNEAAKLFRQAAEEGHAKSQYYMGLLCEYGDGVTQSDEDAVNWYRQAADQGDPASQTNLGWMYSKGRGLAQSYEEAVNWYRKAADQGFAMAQNNLGIMYNSGQGVAKDPTSAVEWYKKSADQGYANQWSGNRS